MEQSHPAEKRVPPAQTRGVADELRAFFLHRPAIQTLVRFASPEEQESYSYRILQRLGLDVRGYSVLNLHKIGIEAPVQYVFEELLGWGWQASCWPNHVAMAERRGDEHEHIRILMLGLRRLGGGRGWRIPPLFDLTALRIQRVPGASDPDNARYALYACSGGYPIGIFVLYVRSPIAEQGEDEASQFFLGVGFDFYGREKWRIFHPINRIWETVHNRVTANVLNRFKALCEWRFERIQAGL
jgi:hypothetical protein